MPSRKAIVLYQYFHPDEVVSARLYTDLCTHLADEGWLVEAWTSNRSFDAGSEALPLHGRLGKVRMKRLWRPAWKTSSGIGRILSALWLLFFWSIRLLLCRTNQPSVIIIGTDPPLSILLALVVRRAIPGASILHWCFDLYPEIAFVEGILRPFGSIGRALSWLCSKAYQSCDVIINLGPRMRQHLRAHTSYQMERTLTPWALREPAQVAEPDSYTRGRLFQKATLGLLYSGNLGRAHEYKDFLRLARRLRDLDVRMVFGARGARVVDLRSELRPEDSNISLFDFVGESELEQNLGAADIHLVSIREGWEGLVVPSKFFGSLAVGRPVIYSGPRNSEIAQWITDFKIGWILDEESLESVAAAIGRYSEDPRMRRETQDRCFRVYRDNFSRRKVLSDWVSLLESLT